MATTRRLGSENSATRATLMDGVEAVMRELGYGALTARSVAERAGLKHQLVYYYFETMDELLMATYLRHTGRVADSIEQALGSPRPLHALWLASSNPHDAVLNMEFLALANHNAAIRAETVAFGERVRRIGLAAIQANLEQSGTAPDAATPLALAIAVSSLGMNLGMEATLGIAGGHAELNELVEWCLDRLESPAPGRPG
ncbi:MAG: TetR/AcrR family transcriptional regulator [Novosphingobium sp.]